MQQAERIRYFPDIDRLSIISASVLLAYFLIRLIDLPGTEFGVQFPGFYLAIPLNASNLAALLVAGLTASGANEIVRHHPSFEGGSTVKYWLLPGLMALVIAMPLNELSENPYWWLGYIVGGCVLTLVLVAEYISVDPQDQNYQFAAIGLQTIAYALFLTLVIVLRFSGTRLFLLLPAVAAATFLVSLRTLELRLQAGWNYIPAFAAALLVTQIAAGMHFLPVSPVAFGLVLLGPAYAVSAFLGNMEQKIPIPQAILEPIFLLVLIWAAGFLLK